MSQALKKFVLQEKEKRLSSILNPNHPKLPKYVTEEDYRASKEDIDGYIIYLQEELDKLRNMMKQLQFQNALGLQAMGNLQTASSTATWDNTIDSGDYLYFGDSSTDGSWRMYVSGTSLLVERRESGVWVEKSSFTA